MSVHDEIYKSLFFDLMVKYYDVLAVGGGLVNDGDIGDPDVPLEPYMQRSIYSAINNDNNAKTLVVVFKAGVVDDPYHECFIVLAEGATEVRIVETIQSDDFEICDIYDSLIHLIIEMTEASLTEDKPTQAEPVNNVVRLKPALRLVKPDESST